MPIDNHYFDLLKRTLREKFVPHLPTLVEQFRTTEDRDKKNLSRAFSAFVLHHLCNISEKMAAESVVDDYDDQGIDAIFYDGNSVYIVQSKLKGAEQFHQEEAHALCEGVRQLLRLNFDGFNRHFAERKTDIEDAIENCSRIEIIIAHIGDGISQHAKNAINQFLKEGMDDEERLSSQFIDINYQKVIDFIRQRNAYERVDTKIWLECYKSISEPKLSYFGLVNVADLVALHEKYGKALYEKNIRTFLGMGLKQGVNDAIQQTLRNKPENFCYLNNGITALCHIIDPKDTREGRKRLKLTGLSVINGAQTISSSAYAKSKGVDISKAKVMLTLIKADTDSEFGKSITKARNHQNPVNLSDFVALEEDQERLRREAACLGIHYDYKKGVSGQAKTPDRIDIEEAVAALAVFNSDPRYAIWLKKEPAKLYQTDGDQYKGLFPSDLKIHTLINAVYFYRYIQNQMPAQVASSSGVERLTYKHGTYVLAWVLSKRLKTHIDAAILLNEAAFSTAMSQPFDEARNRLFNIVSQQDRGALAIFRNQTHAIPVIQQMMLEDYGLVQDHVISRKQSQYTTGQAYPLALFEYMIENAPQITLGS